MLTIHQEAALRWLLSPCREHGGTVGRRLARYMPHHATTEGAMNFREAWEALMALAEEHREEILFGREFAVGQAVWPRSGR
ncbi:MAG: hypothetical protein ABSG68_26960 [Thermoguttaceae bacterium]|jgi:hypothetical protein